MSSDLAIEGHLREALEAVTGGRVYAQQYAPGAWACIRMAPAYPYHGPHILSRGHTSPAAAYAGGISRVVGDMDTPPPSCSVRGDTRRYSINPDLCVTRTAGVYSIARSGPSVGIVELDPACMAWLSLTTDNTSKETT